MGLPIGVFNAIDFPWPASPSTAMVTVAGAALELLGDDPPTAEQTAKINDIMLLLSDRIEQYAPDAPMPSKREAARRLLGYLRNHDGSQFGDVKIAGAEITMPAEHSRAFRLSGAMGALKPYRIKLAAATWDDE